MLLDILRDGLADDELTTDDISRRELDLDKEIIQLIQSACKDDKLARAIDLTKLLHHNASFDMAIKVAGFYHLIGLQEKMHMLKDDREDDDRLIVAREKRRERAGDFAAIPAPRPFFVEPSKPKAFQDFRPPPAIHRPGLERATPAADSFRASGTSKGRKDESSLFEPDEFQSSAADFGTDYSYEPTPEGKRKRSEEPLVISDSNGKRRAMESAQTSLFRLLVMSRMYELMVVLETNPFARKAGADNGRNPFNRNADANKSLHKSESFFNKVDAAEAEKPKRECCRHSYEDPAQLL